MLSLRKNDRTKKLLLFLGINLLLSTCLLLFFLHIHQSNAGGIKDEATASTLNPDHINANQLEVLIEKVGAKKAYVIFSNSLNPITSIARRHELAHVMGIALYNTVGTSGIGVCDKNFTYGCYHSLIGKAMADKGTEVASNLYTVCTQTSSPGGCIHGIGHGALYSLGSEKLVAALDLCGDLTKNKESFICTSGVFMEYNMNTMNNPDGNPLYIRQANGNDHSPCTSIPLPYRKACYFGLPLWWNARNSNSTKTAETLGKLCQQVANEDEKSACYLGVGEVSAELSDYNPKRAQQNCAKMPDRRYEVLCLSSVSFAFDAIPQHKEIANSFCANMSAEEKIVCTQRRSQLTNHLL